MPSVALSMCPPGSAVFDFYGGDRIGNDLFADSLIALDAETGKRIWHFQGVHHDLWDRDFPAPPAMVTVTRDGKRVDAIAQTTKSGLLFVFDRATGKSLFPIKELPFPSQQCSRRSHLAHPADPHLARALHAAEHHDRYADQPHARSACLGSEAVQHHDRRRPVHSAQRGQAHRRHAGICRGRGVGWRRRRSRPPECCTSTPMTLRGWSV